MWLDWVFNPRDCFTRVYYNFSTIAKSLIQYYTTTIITLLVVPLHAITWFGGWRNIVRWIRWRGLTIPSSPTVSGHMILRPVWCKAKRNILEYTVTNLLTGGVLAMEKGITLFLARRTQLPIPRTTIPVSPSKSKDCLKLQETKYSILMFCKPYTNADNNLDF